MSDELWHRRLRQARHLAGLTRHELAEKVGVHKGTVDEWERGARMPNGRALLVLEEVLTGLRETPNGDPRDPNGFVVHLPMDPARRARVLVSLLQMTFDEQDQAGRPAR